LVPKPTRVKNIFICSGVVFCASSRITKALFERAPAHEGQRSDFQGLAFKGFVHLIKSHQVVQRVVQRAQIGIDFLVQVAGKKPRRSPASTAGRVRMMRCTALRCSASTAAATAQIGLAGAGGADADGDVVAGDVVQVASLVAAAGFEVGAARRQRWGRRRKTLARRR
jgi:hypothetical protein